MKLLNRLERKFGGYAIPHLTLILIAFQSFTYLVCLIHPEFISKIILTHETLFAGEWWRLLTLLFIPPATSADFLLWFLFWMSLYFTYGTALETQWGTFRYNLFILIGYLGTIAAALIPGATVSNLYLMGSIFLAFAWLYPDFQLLILFIIPVKVKWIALLTWITYAIFFLMGNWPIKVEIAGSVLNFVLFFHGELRQSLKTSGRKFKGDMARARDREPKPPMHVCAECGVTDQSDRKMEFRYCPQCKGTPAYCINHINNHKHR